MSDATKLIELLRAASVKGGMCDVAADLIEQQAARIAELEAQIAAVAPAVDAQPVAWMLEWTHSGEVREQRLYDDERHCLLDAETNGGVCVPLGRIVASAQSDGLRKALTEIAEQEHIELMLDPTWAQRIAIAALAQHTGEKS